jgi:glycosyltransferase involved in cell wall biosynthesis
MFRSNALIDVEILAERVRTELALLEKRRRIRLAAEETPRSSGMGLAAAASIGVAKPDFAKRAKQLIKDTPVVGDLARTTWRAGQAIGRMGQAVWRMVQDTWGSVLSRLIEPRHSDATPAAAREERNVIFVGSWRERNGQLELVRAFSTLRMMCETPVRLTLAGKISSTDYFNQVQAEIHSRELDQDVIILKNPGPDELDRLYRRANLYVSLSFREFFFSSIGSNPPPVQAMACDLPVVAYGDGVISALLGSGGLVLETREPDIFAIVAKLVLEEPWLRRQVIQAQRREFRRLQRLSIRKRLKAITALGWRKSRIEDRRNIPAWRIEGPFDSSYSLAIVNREVSLALSEQGQAVGLVSRDGPGPFPPAADFLQKNPASEALWRAGQTSGTPDVALRNTYPPWVSDVAGDLRGIVCYAWEESGFPRDYVVEFNCNLDLATVTSRYVAKVLRDNGVRAPIRVVGDGIDQITRLDSGKHETERLQKFGIGDRFCFLHISSGFPRKGLDVLLAAWAKAFRDSDDIVLVIKTSPNQHHQIEDKVAALSKADPQHAPIVVINQSMEAAEIYALYRRADVVVAPSRGEGFGLPIAEALALAKPTITTAFGGQMDFCSAESAWLCDYDFVYARSHLSTPLSVWVEPRLDSLVGCLQQARNVSADERARRGRIGQAFLRKNYAWKDVADRLQSAVADVRALDTRALRLPKVGWVSTWNSRCGIAAYSEALTSEIPPDRLVVFANYNAQLLGADPPLIKRTWEQGWRDPLDQLYEAIDDAKVDAVVIQFNFGFIALQALARLIDRLNEKRISVYLSLHSTNDIERPDLTIRLADAADSLRGARRLLVHSVHDLNRLKARGLIDNVTLLPFGLPQPPKKRQHNTGHRKLIASFGYLLAHKGLPELIEAVSILRRDGLDVDLLMLNALYPGEESQKMKAVCEEAIRHNGMTGHVNLRTEYLSEDEIVSELGAADLIVYPYQETQESASAAVRLGLASLAPVATTPLPIFDDVVSITHRLPGTAAGDVAAGIRHLLTDSSALSRLSEAQESWVSALQWQAVSRRLYDLIRGEFVDDMICVQKTSAFNKPS